MCRSLKIQWRKTKCSENFILHIDIESWMFPGFTSTLIPSWGKIWSLGLSLGTYLKNSCSLRYHLTLYRVSPSMSNLDMDNIQTIINKRHQYLWQHSTLCWPALQTCLLTHQLVTGHLQWHQPQTDAQPEQMLCTLKSQISTLPDEF